MLTQRFKDGLISLEEYKSLKAGIHRQRGTPVLLLKSSKIIRPFNEESSGKMNEKNFTADSLNKS